jgi:hypothetical protein
MAAGERIFAVTSVNALAAATHIGLEPSTAFVVDPGAAGFPGPADFVVTAFDLAVTIYGEDEAELMALVAAAAADLVVGTLGAAGAAETWTISDVYFDEVPSEMAVPANDAGGKVPVFAVRGHVQAWEAANTFASKLSAV